jgi:hypothetical protein
MAYIGVRVPDRHVPEETAACIAVAVKNSGIAGNRGGEHHVTPAFPQKPLSRFRDVSAFESRQGHPNLIHCAALADE